MEGIVLAKRDYREYDQMVTILTRRHGLQRYVARGIKKVTSKNAAALEPFSFVFFGVAQGKEFGYITNVHIQEYFLRIRTQLQASQMASTVCYLLPRIIREGEPGEDIFVLLHNFLSELSKAQHTQMYWVDIFFFRLLCLLGYQPSFADNDYQRSFIFHLSRFGNNNDHAGMPISFHLQQVLEGCITTPLWQIPSLDEDGDLQQALHQFVLGYLEAQIEREIKDWNSLILA